MPFQKGDRANPGGRPKEKIVTDAIRLAVSRVDADGVKKLYRIADKLTDCAMSGEGWAIAMVADRLDGKPAQETTVTVRNELDSMTDAELRDFIRRELAGGSASSDGAAEPPHPGFTH